MRRVAGVGGTGGVCAGRRGHALVLVAGLLALLAVVAAAYLARARSERRTSVAVQQAATRSAADEAVANEIAREIADALFLFPIAPPPGPLPSYVATSNRARRAPAPDAERYGVDVPNHPYHFAPYQVVPFTNWPDESNPLWRGVPARTRWPRGTGARAGDAGLGETNPLGNPGSGDTRWLRDLEPLRGDGDRDGRPDTLLYFRHLTDLARPNNGWRLCRDISDVTGARGDGGGGILAELDIPAEQWLASVPPAPEHFAAATGTTVFPVDDPAAFMNRWRDWLSPEYLFAYTDPARIPPNFYRLSDLDGDGITHEESAGERTQDEFAAPSARWPQGAPRWNVGRVLADADGDGFTDAFWFLVPASVEDDVRRIVAVSIVDNGAMFDANVATRFCPGPFGTGAAPDAATAGETPADLAAVGEQRECDFAVPSWNVGFFDASHNWEPAFDFPAGYPGTGPYPLYDDGEGTIQIAWLGARGASTGATENRWKDFLRELGVWDNPEGLFPHELRSARERRRYWLMAASRPAGGAAGGLTPFTAADEIELRLYAGQNHPWVLSRFERAVNTDSTVNAFLRSGVGFEESNERLDRLDAVELLHDHRRKTTLFSGARNDELPPWLQWRWRMGVPPNEFTNVPVPVRRDASADPQAVARFLAQARTKLDLREGSDFDARRSPGQRPLHERLPWTLLLALADGNERGLAGSDFATAGFSYFGAYDDGPDLAVRERLRQLAASWTANMLAYSDADADAPLFDDPATGEIGAIGLPQWNTVPAGPLPGGEDVRFLGLERQPFLVEAFIAHVYEASQRIPGDDGAGWSNSGARIILEDDGTRPLESTVAVVQIANPCDRPVDLTGERFSYEIELFGQEPIRLADVAGAMGITRLPPARDGRPATMVLYSIDDALGDAEDFGRRWLDFLDLEESDHPRADHPSPGDAGTILVDLRRLDGAGRIHAWSTGRAVYDDPAVEHALRLVRVERDARGAEHRVVVDRIDDPRDADRPDAPSFLREVQRQAQDRPLTFEAWRALPAPPPVASPPAGHAYPDGGWSPPDQSRTHWAQWVRVTRAWGYDFEGADGGAGGDGVVGPGEHNPRYVYAVSQVTTAADPARGDPRPGYAARVFSAGGEPGVSFSLAEAPDDGEAGAPWFTLDYPLGGPAGVARHNRKPTFFDLEHGRDADPETWSFPDKGFYHSAYPLQMLQKDGDFQQVGEVLDVWLWGHELRFDASGGLAGTVTTFSERLAAHRREHGDGDRFANRLLDRFGPLGIANPTQARDPMHAVPVLPAATRVLDALVCDGPGRSRADDPSTQPFRCAAGFSGRATPGLINVNTAPVEVLRTLPHWYKLVPRDPDAPGASFPRCAIPEALISYRERFGNGAAPGAVGVGGAGGGIGFAGGPDYRGRGAFRGDRGLAALGELLLLDRPAPARVADADLGDLSETSWTIGFASTDPFARPGSPIRGADLSTDVCGASEHADTDAAAAQERTRVGRVEPKGSRAQDGPDGVSGDVEEANLLLAGAANLITTRSDLFTVYFRVRSFRRNPDTLRWDATDPERIVEDSRYVMLVDRSEVNHPADPPRILYLEKAPN